MLLVWLDGRLSIKLNLVMPASCVLLACLQAAVEVGAEDAARLAELSKQLSKETAQLAKLRASCDGLQKKAAALQVR
jgi:cell division protein FtsB